MIQSICVLLFSVLACSVWASDLRIEKVPVPAAHGMYVHSPSQIWLSDTFKNLSNRSSVHDSRGKRVQVTPQGVGIAGIAKHPFKNEFMFSDTMGSQVFVVDAAGKESKRFSVGNPWNARWTPSGQSILVVTYSGSVQRIENDGAIDDIVTSLDAPFDIAATGEHSFWASEQGAAGDGKVCLYSMDSVSKQYEMKVCNKDRLLNPEGLWPLPDGSVAVVDTEAGTLVKIGKDGIAKILSKGLGIPILLQVLGGGDWVVYTNQSPVGPAVIFGNSKELQ